MLLIKDSSESSEEETSAAMAQSGRFSQKLEESDDDFNSNLSVLNLYNKTEKNYLLGYLRVVLL